jgi:hypothetical protein
MHLSAERSAAKTSAFKEDLHYSFVEYSGGNITHWSFLDSDDAIDVERLCGRLFLVTDMDSEKKLERQEKLRERLGDRYACLECREIENLLNPHILKSVISDYEKSADNVNDVQYKDYANKPLGKFIENKCLPKEKRRTGSYAEPSGTLTDKIGFCRRAIDAIKSWDDLSEPAQALTKRIYEFIASNNQ